LEFSLKGRGFKPRRESLRKNTGFSRWERTLKLTHHPLTLNVYLH
jgi:hypothetical protein